MRGEHAPVKPLATTVPGSSPHARGALAAARLQLEDLGIIPACAGSITGGDALDAWAGDHPRMRGEHAL